MPTAVEDKDEIREALAEYCFRLDDQQFAEMAALFTADGTWDTAFGKATGRDNIIALVRSLAPHDGTRPRRAHLTTNIVIKLAGDRASVASNWTVVQNSPRGPIVSSGGSYADEMVRQDGKWLFHYRKIDRYIREGGD